MSLVEIAGIFIIPIVIAISAAFMYWQVSNEASMLTSVDANAYAMPADELIAIIQKHAPSRGEEEAQEGVEAVEEKVAPLRNDEAALLNTLAELEHNLSNPLTRTERGHYFYPIGGHHQMTSEAAVRAAKEAARRFGVVDLGIDWPKSVHPLPIGVGGSYMVLKTSQAPFFQLLRRDIKGQMYTVEMDPRTFETRSEFKATAKHGETEPPDYRPASSTKT